MHPVTQNRTNADDAHQSAAKSLQQELAKLPEEQRLAIVLEEVCKTVSPHSVQKLRCISSAAKMAGDDIEKGWALALAPHTTAGSTQAVHGRSNV